jgi:hypothetical protein
MCEEQTKKSRKHHFVVIYFSNALERASVETTSSLSSSNKLKQQLCWQPASSQGSNKQ